MDKEKMDVLRQTGSPGSMHHELTQELNLAGY